MSPRYDIQDLKDRLVARLPEMIADRLSNARRRGNAWYVGSLDNETGRSCVIKAAHGGFVDYGDAAPGRERGDVLKLWAILYENSPVITQPVIQRAAEFAGLAPEAAPRDPAEEERKERARQARIEARARRDAEAAEGKRKYWKGQWLAAKRCVSGDPVWSYLSQVRGLDPAAFQIGGALPGGIRYAADWPFWEDSGETDDKGRPKLRKYTAPAMVAQVLGPLDPLLHKAGTYGQLAVHATQLAYEDGGWRAVKEADDSGRLRTLRRMYGASRGGLIPVWKAGKTTPFTKAPASATLAIAEGIEDALTIALAKPDWYVAAGHSLDNLKNIRSPSPKGFGTVVIVADADWDKPGCLKKVRKVYDRVVLSGRNCRVVFSQEGKDFNDWLRASPEASDGADGADLARQACSRSEPPRARDAETRTEGAI